MSIRIFDMEETQNLSKLSKRLLAWYDAEARVLPWRSNPEPYRVWVSEIMLQQTRVETVIPYFERFLAQLPSISALAAASEQTLLKLWEGLGYYSRVRNLQKGAQAVQERFGGELPAHYEELLTLPGIGEYTAGAIASIAFGLPVPAVDGNVLRVFSRLFASSADIANPQVKKDFKELVLKIQPKDRPGDFNQALMDLGATVCVPGAPRCGVCPLEQFCMARRRGMEAELPVKAAAKARRHEQKTVLVVVSGGKVLLHRRAPKGLLGGLWEFPNLEGILVEQQVRLELEKWGAQPVRMERLPDAQHIFSHVEWHMRGYSVTADNFSPPPDCEWVAFDLLKKDYALPSAFKAYNKLPVFST